MVACSADEAVSDRSWITTLAALRSRHLRAGVASLGASRRGATIADLLVASRPRYAAPAGGSEAWVRLLGEGGAEDLDASVW